ncbi:MAG: fimbria/pilus outer membrane usher protein, partial [Pseudomonadota bacterium]
MRSLAPDITFRFDENELTLHIWAKPELFEMTKIDLAARRPAELRYLSNHSAFLNYAVNTTGLRNLSASAEVGCSLGDYLFQTTAGFDQENVAVRNTTNFVYHQRKKLRHWVVGDTVAGGDELGGGAMLGGIALVRDFTLDPYFRSNPAGQLSGTILSPSTVDVYVNDTLVHRDRLQPGEFQVANLPQVAGVGSARVVVRDAFGREQMIASPYYLSTGLLAAGLSDYAAYLGFRRERFSTESWSYSTPVALG